MVIVHMKQTTPLLKMQAASESLEGTGLFVNEELSNPQSSRTFYNISISLFAAIGGFLFGYDTGVINGALLYLEKSKDEGGLDLSNFWQVSCLFYPVFCRLVYPVFCRLVLFLPISLFFFTPLSSPFLFFLFPLSWLCLCVVWWCGWIGGCGSSGCGIMCGCENVV